MNKFKNAVAIIESENENPDTGTAFLVTKDYLITSKHFYDTNIGESFKVKFVKDEKWVQYEVEGVYTDEGISGEEVPRDIAVVKLKESITNITPLPVDMNFIDYEKDDTWESFGYPSDNPLGTRYAGTINNISFANTSETTVDMILNCTEPPNITDPDFVMGGTSGAPVMVDGAVIGLILRDEKGGGIGCANFAKSNDFLRKTIKGLDKGTKKTRFQSILDEAIEGVKDYIMGFSDELKPILEKELGLLKEYILENQDEVIEGLKKTKYPKANDKNYLDSLDSMEATLELLLLLKSSFSKVDFLTNDDFANISLAAKKNKFANLIHSLKRNALMPEIMLSLNREMMGKAYATIMIKNEEPFPPFPTILDNCNTSKRFTLCRECKSEFSFEEIIRNYVASEDDELIKGIELNNYESLNKARVICGSCIRGVNNSVENISELQSNIGGKMYGN